MTMDAQLITEYDTRISMARCYEFGEQVLAKPRRSNQQVKKKGALEPRFHDSTWVGYNDRTTGHIVVLK